MKGPRGEPQNIIKNGQIHNGKPRYICKNCGRPWVANPPHRRLTAETKPIMANGWLEKVSWRGIPRLTGVAVSGIPESSQKISREARSIPLSSKNQVRWLLSVMRGGVRSAIELQRSGYGASRRIVGYPVGQRGKQEALRLWQSLPPVYRQCAVGYTDNWKASRGIGPRTRHRVSGNNTGKTNPIERFNHTLRQRISRLGRKTLAFSNKLDNHIGAIAYFIHHYNSSLL